MADPTRADRAILAVLREGARTQGYIVDHTDFSRTHVRNRLQIMEARGWVRNLHEATALWELRDDAPDEPPNPEDVMLDDEPDDGSE